MMCLQIGFMDLTESNISVELFKYIAVYLSQASWEDFFKGKTKACLKKSFEFVR